MKAHEMTEYSYRNRNPKYSEKLKRAVKKRGKELELAHEELLKKNAELSTLLAVTRSLLKSRDINELLGKAIEGALTLIPSEAGALLLINPDSGLIELASFHNIESLPIPDLPHMPKQLHFGFDDRYISMDDPKIKPLARLLSISNLLNSDRDYNYENGISGGIRNILSGLLSGMDGISGVIYVINKVEGDYTEEDARFLLAFSNEAAIAIENLKIHSTLLEKEKEVQRQRRLATLGEMSAQIAHEIRNPLQKILTGVEYLRDYCEVKDSSVVDIVSKGVSSINLIISKMVEYGKPAALDLQDVDIPDMLEEILSGSRDRLSLFKIAVSRDFPEKAKVVLDPIRFKQGIQNVIDNAVDAMREGGRLTLSMRYICEENERPSKVACKPVSPSSMLEIKVSDTGVGMDKEGVSKLFTPFYTTKVNGSGLGMAMVKKIADLHKGEVFVKS
ncbi:MAG: ATP-binding protein, partial [Deltaproteobacteria bacterium]